MDSEDQTGPPESLSVASCVKMACVVEVNGNTGNAGLQGKETHTQSKELYSEETVTLILILYDEV